MKILNKTNINPINQKDLDIILDCDITNSNVPLNDVSVVVSIYDTTENFIDQKIIKGSEFKYQWNNEEDLLLYFRNEIIDIDNNEDLNDGRYQLRFSFILDTFNTVDNSENKFIVTEISPDGSEIRLNPLSNNEEFINTFSRLKKYEKTEKEIELNERGFVRFYRNYIDSVFSDSNISDIFSDSEVNINGLSFTEYLTSVYIERSSISNISERNADAKEKALDDVEEMKTLLKSKKGDAFIFISQYYENNKSELFKKIKNTSLDNEVKRNSILNEFKMEIKNQTENFLNDSIVEIVNLVLKN